MSSSDGDLQKYVGQSLASVRQQLESQGYLVHEVRHGRYATGHVPARPLVVGEPEPERQKRAVVSYNGDDPEHKVTAIRRDDY